MRMSICAKASKYSGAYVGEGYVHDDAKGQGEKSITFQPEIPKNGRYEVWLAYSAGTNRDAKVPVTVFSADGEKTIHVDQRKQPDIDGLFVSLGQYRFEKSGQGFVIIENEGTTGHVIADAGRWANRDTRAPCVRVGGHLAAREAHQCDRT